MFASNPTLCIIGLGYVGLPLAVEFGKKITTIGFDINQHRIDELRRGVDHTLELDAAELNEAKSLRYTTHEDDIKGCDVYIVTVPTPINDSKQPDLTPLEKASQLLGRVIGKNSIVVFESTVYPGCTEEICVPLIERGSGLVFNRDFFAGYSPERINPGDKKWRLETITKIVSAENPAALERVKAVYSSIIEAGLHVAPSIKVAEAAKVIENTQRDINIALMNEIALIFDLMGIRTKDVLAAAGTKWNFLPFTPGLVGGHCIGVDPYYLTAAAERLGYRPEVILAGRRINDSMGAMIANKMVKLLVQGGRNVGGARIGILGLTFKEDVPDLRNSKVPDIIAELREFGIEPLVHDPLANSEEARHEYGLELSPFDAFADLDGLVLAVNHREYLDRASTLPELLTPGGVLIDVKSALDIGSVLDGLIYWSL